MTSTYRKSLSCHSCNTQNTYRCFNSEVIFENLTSDSACNLKLVHSLRLDLALQYQACAATVFTKFWSNLLLSTFGQDTFSLTALLSHQTKVTYEKNVDTSKKQPVLELFLSNL